MNYQTNWFRVPKPLQDPVARLICFPYAGGNAGSYVNWAKSLPDGIELVAVEPPGRAVRMLEPPFDNMADLISDLLPHYQRIIDKPYLVFGHSLGGRVAYEISCCCQQLGLRLPNRFIASASRAPHIVKQRPNIYDLPDIQFLDKLRGFNGTPESVLTNREMMELLLPMLRSDFKIADLYLAQPQKLKCPLSVWHGEMDHEISQLDFKSWADCSVFPVEFTSVPGGHLFVDSNVQDVLARLNPLLERLGLGLIRNGTDQHSVV